MPDELLHAPHRCAMHRQVRAERVTQDVNAGRHLRALGRVANALPGALSGDRRPVVFTQHATAAEMPLLADRCRQPFGHPDDPNASILRRRQLATPVGVPHPNLPSFEIDVGPLECNDFARPQPSLASEKRDEVAARVDRFRGFQQALVVTEIVECRVGSRNPYQPDRMKASEICPRVHFLIGQVFRDAGFGDGIVNVITNDPQDAAVIVDALIDHPAIKRINFTGSTRVGRIIAQRAARHLKPVLLELGGKAPLLVLEDADLDEAVKAASFGAFMHQGQICMSTERIIVVDGVADEFASKLRDKAATMVAGDPRAGKTPLGAMIERSNVEAVNRLVADALAKGATRLAGNEGSGVLMPACVIDHVTEGMALYREESFGPVVALIRARDDDHAVDLANDTEYGLSAAVFSRDIARALKVVNASSQVFATSTVRPFRTRLKCRLAARTRAATGGSAASRVWRSSPNCAGLRWRQSLGIFRF